MYLLDAHLRGVLLGTGLLLGTDDCNRDASDEAAGAATTSRNRRAGGHPAPSGGERPSTEPGQGSAFVAAAPLRLEMAVPVLAVARADTPISAACGAATAALAPATPPLNQPLACFTSFFISGNSGTETSIPRRLFVPKPICSPLIPLDPVGELSDLFCDGRDLLTTVFGDALVHRLLIHLEVLQRGLVKPARLLGDGSTGRDVQKSLGRRRPHRARQAPRGERLEAARHRPIEFDHPPPKH